MFFDLVDTVIEQWLKRKKIFATHRELAIFFVIDLTVIICNAFHLSVLVHVQL